MDTLRIRREYQGLDKIGMQQALVEYFRRQEGRNKRVTLVIDEAQALGPEVLEELRLFSNVNFGQTTLLQTVLVGQLSLRDTLRHPAMRQFAQCVAVDYVLTPLDKDQTQAYIRHRLSIANPVRRAYLPRRRATPFSRQATVYRGSSHGSRRSARESPGDRLLRSPR